MCAVRVRCTSPSRTSQASAACYAVTRAENGTTKSVISAWPGVVGEVAPLREGARSRGDRKAAPRAAQATQALREAAEIKKRRGPIIGGLRIRSRAAQVARPPGFRGRREELRAAS